MAKDMTGQNENRPATQNDVRLLKHDVLLVKNDVLLVKNDVLLVKNDVLAVRSELRDSVTGLRKELHDSAADLRKELHDSAADLRAELHDSAAGLRSEFRESTAELRNDNRKVMLAIAQVVGALAEMKESTKTEIRELRSEMHTRMDGFAGSLNDFRRQWAFQSDALMLHEGRLDDHERRLGKIESRPQ